MTLHELWLVVVKRWKLIVAVPVVCAVACFAYLSFYNSGGGSYTASSCVVANTSVQSVAGMAASEGRQYIDQLKSADSASAKGLEIVAKGDTNMMTVTITVTGPDGDACVKAANAVAEATNARAEEALVVPEGLSYAGQVEFATKAQFDKRSGLKYPLVAILGGLFVAICIAVVLDMRKRPVKTAEGAQDAVELPVLEVLPAANGERLLANIRFAAKKDDLASVYIVPAGDGDVARKASELVQAAAGDEGARGVSVEVGAPLGESMQAAYDARSRDAVVVSVRQWVDTLPQLESAVAELRLADANLVGLVFAKGKLG